MQAGPQQPRDIPPRLEPTGVFTGLQIRSIVAGMVVDYLGTYVAMYAYLVIFVSRQLFERGELSDEAIRSFLTSPEGLLVGFVIGSLCTVLGGFVAGRMAKNLEVKHGAFVGIGSALVSMLEQTMSEGPSLVPQWYLLISYFASLPLGALGGYIAERLGSAAMPRSDRA